MTLYEIEAQMQALLDGQVDEETGEIVCDMDALEQLMLARDTKIENIACYIKNLTAETTAIREEEKALAKRRQTEERHAERLKTFLAAKLNGEKINTPRVAISWRRSEQVDISPDFFSDDRNEQYLRYKDPEPDKTAIKAALKAGETIPGAELITNLNMQIK